VCNVADNFLVITKKNKFLMEQLQRYQENNTLLEDILSETKNIVIILKEKVEVAKKRRH
jgi:hypothetical protein